MSITPKRAKSMPQIAHFPSATVVDVKLAFQVVDPRSDDAMKILDLYGQDMRLRYGESAPYGSEFVPIGVDEPTGRFLIGYLESRPVSCGGLRQLDNTMCEVKMMFVDPDFRRCGFARQTLASLETLASGLNFDVVRLNTGSLQPEALNLYLTSGYSHIGAYNDNPYASYWLEKLLIAVIP